MSNVHATLAGRTDEMISAAVRGLVAQRKADVAELAAAVGVSRAALYRKLGNSSPWWADEVDRLARFFQVSRDSLYEGRADFGTFDYGSEGWEFESLRARSPFRRGDRRRRLSVVPLYLCSDVA